MNLTDLNALTNIQLLEAATSTANVTGPVVDLSQYIGTLKVTQHVGAVTGTTPNLAGSIQDSADGVNFAPVAGLAFANVTASHSEQSLQLDTRATRRYIQYIGNIGGTTPSYVLAVDAVGVKKNLP